MYREWCPVAEASESLPMKTEELIDEAIQFLVYEQMNVGEEERMAKGYQEMAAINLRLSEMCFAAESEVEQFFEDRIAECE